ncbi:ribose 5-phosphate isomerase B [Stackebrandtia albiflava]|uniref:Ribose 5-phosphate isomerase B n=1 Tax=Stackebrandtia albiflava TaxID=406432 RepID=A0A562VGQ5_9ACTN|nr:RpiB/LacA/LacB family sugar-phosphate isomerase [Stackebrandtia albiflava]TWJ17095.1 ribose 5-phosphate isomerase B [Stackebrandtia albiflava]
MRISVASDSLDGVAALIGTELERRGHTVSRYGAVADPDDVQWARVSARAAQDVATGDADMAVVACWTGTGASIAANKVPGVRAALCTDPGTAAGARRWNDANVLAVSLRTLSAPMLGEILDAWFATAPSGDSDDLANIAHLRTLDHLPADSPPMH